jgi:hypothetical protein
MPCKNEMWRDGFVPQYLRRKRGFPLFAGARNNKNWCGRWESNPHGPCSPADFHAVYGFRRLGADACEPAPSLRSGLSLHHPPQATEIRCRPSSLYTFLNCFRLGSGSPFQVSPTLGSSAPPVSRRALKFSLSPLRMPFRHARVARCFQGYILR